MLRNAKVHRPVLVSMTQEWRSWPLGRNIRAATECQRCTRRRQIGQRIGAVGIEPRRDQYKLRRKRIKGGQDVAVHHPPKPRAIGAGGQRALPPGGRRNAGTRRSAKLNRPLAKIREF